MVVCVFMNQAELGWQSVISNNNDDRVGVFKNTWVKKK